jgi:hypothetical protein
VKQPPETIYLIPGEDIDGRMGWLWCDDPAPSRDHDPDEAVKYVRAESAKAIERDVAFRQRDLAYKQRDEMELKWSKARQEARDLSERIEELETMVKVFRGCIETGLMPKPGSPCQKKVFELVGEREGIGGEQ